MPWTLTLNLTPGEVQTVFLVHGIAQNGGELGDLKNLAASLRDPIYGIDGSRFIVDAGFDFSGCANNKNCDQSLCTIQTGAATLASYINQKNPTGDIVLVGYSMGGLIARDMILNNYHNVITNHHVGLLITLGTPHLGYPYLPIDGDPVQPFARCNSLAGQMFGDFRNPASEAPDLPVVASPAYDFLDPTGNNIALSAYLYQLNAGWAMGGVGPGQWLAVAGSWCQPGPDLPYLTRLFSSEGCPSATGADGVVCESSAAPNISNGPMFSYIAPAYSHSSDFSTFVLFCQTAGSYALFDPPIGGDVLSQIQTFINGLPQPSVTFKRKAK
jgi:pimeloyl-ACP methyl ester carboxylesterase